LYELSRVEVLRRTAICQAIGILLVVCHIILVKQSLLFYPALVGILAWVYLLSRLDGTLLFCQFLLYQNLAISLLCGDMDHTTFVALQGTSFAVLCVMALISGVRLWPYWGTFRSTGLWIAAALAMVVAYSVLGMTKAGLTSAAIYFREFSSPLLALLIGLDLGRTYHIRTVGLGYLYGSAMLLCVCLVEFAWPVEYYDGINAVKFYNLKYEGIPFLYFYTAREIVEHYTSVLFNVTGTTSDTYNNFRVGGPVMNPISNAYVLAVCGLVALSLGRLRWLIVIGPLLVVVGVKGATLLIVCSLAAWLVWYFTRDAKISLIFGFFLAALYVSSGLYVGLQNDDFHVIGFMGGVHGFVLNPIGHGIGVGGNLSAKAAAGFNWTGGGGLQRTGADFALESAVGVLLYQMGVASVAIFAVFFVALRNAPWRHIAGQTDILLVALAFIVLNGIFQEEAYSPYAAGILMLFTGSMITNPRHERQSFYENSFGHVPAFARAGS
jgi:hypothetical protein